MTKRIELRATQEDVMVAVWIDTSTLGDIADGDAALEMVIKSLTGPRLIPPKVKEELLTGNPFTGGQTRTKDQAAKAQAVMTRLGITVDMKGSADDRRNFFEKQFKFKKDKTVVRSMEESDAIVLSEIAASAKERGISRPRLITTDKRLVNNADAKAWGVEITLPDQAQLEKARKLRANVAKGILAMIEAVKGQHDLLSGEHRIQSDLINKPSALGFAGFWTNRLFNSDVPLLDIWAPCSNSLARARRLLRENNLPAAAAEAVRARGKLIIAAATYRTWKDGIEDAATKMQITIAATAVVLIAAAVAATGAGAAAGVGKTASEATASVQTLTRLVAKGDALAIRVAVSSGPGSATALAEWELAVEEAAVTTAKLLVL